MSEPSLEFGPALHCGDVMYGNIGVAERPSLPSSESPRTRTTTTMSDGPWLGIQCRLACAIQRLGWMTLQPQSSCQVNGAKEEVPYEMDC
jgi:hypothetical protein